MNVLISSQVEKGATRLATINGPKKSNDKIEPANPTFAAKLGRKGRRNAAPSNVAEPNREIQFNRFNRGAVDHVHEP
jgi:hypothetical protein